MHTRGDLETRGKKKKKKRVTHMSSSAVLEHTMRLEFFARCLERRISDPVKSPGGRGKRKEREKGKKEEESSYEYMEAF